MVPRLYSWIRARMLESASDVGRVLAPMLAAMTSDRVADAVGALMKVRSVRNQLRATPGESRIRGRSDAEIRRAVEVHLRAHRMLRQSRIHVAAVYDGLVQLTGTVPSVEHDHAAFETALDVAGVRRVMSDMVVDPSAWCGRVAAA